MNVLYVFLNFFSSVSLLSKKSVRTPLTPDISLILKLTLTFAYALRCILLTLLCIFTIHVSSYSVLIGRS